MKSRRTWASRHLLFMLLTLACSAAALNCATQSEPVTGPLCTEGENIFCRCEGGTPGTKECLEGGAAFGECGPCSPRPGDPGGDGGFGAGNTGGYGNTGGSSIGGGGVGGGSGTVALLEMCAVDGDCLSGMCRFSYCTIPCAKVSECPYPVSECVQLDSNETFCMPTCSTAAECSKYQAPPSMCGYTKAIDNWDVTVCAHWANDHKLMPPGTDCLPFDHPACNLGYQQRETVCTDAGVCAKGCYLNNDCPQGSTCSNQGSLGNCQ